MSPAELTKHEVIHWTSALDFEIRYVGHTQLLLLECYKVDVPNLVTYLNWTPTFEWCMVWCGSKNGYQEDMCLKEFGPHAQNMITILDSIIHIIRAPISSFNEHENFHLDNE